MSKRRVLAGGGNGEGEEVNETLEQPGTLTNQIKEVDVQQPIVENPLKTVPVQQEVISEPIVVKEPIKEEVLGSGENGQKVENIPIIKMAQELPVDLKVPELKKEEIPQMLGTLPPKGSKFLNRFSFTASASVPLCNKDLLSAFGIADIKETPEKASAKDRMYCRRNKYTCCNAKQFKATKVAFDKGANLLRSRFETIEELLSIFRGPSYRDFVENLLEKTECKKELKDATFLDDKIIKIKIDEVETLLNELETFTKRQLWWVGNMYCTICNPFNQDFFNFSDDAKITANESTCREMMEDIDFETRFAQIFESFIRPVTELINCEADALKTRNEDEPKKVVDKIDMEKIKLIKEDFEFCYDSNDFMNPRCTKVCQKPLGSFSFRVKIMKSIKQALDILYKRFAGDEDIAEYYEEVKEQAFFEEDDDSVIEFYPKVEGKVSFKNLKWTYTNEKGITPMNDHMHKNYINGSLLQSLSALLFVALSFIF